MNMFDDDRLWQETYTQQELEQMIRDYTGCDGWMLKELERLMTGAPPPEPAEVLSFNPPPIDDSVEAKEGKVIYVDFRKNH